jgi:small conductance mechanosensitive channel
MSNELEHILRDFVLPIILAFLLAAVVRVLGRYLVARFIKISDFAPQGLRLRQERQKTLRDILSSIIGVAAFSTAILFTLGLFVNTAVLLWLVGLFGAGFSFGANRLVADFMTGISFIVEEHFDVGEKIEVNDIVGVVERINFRTTVLRASSGELYVIPNGEIRTLRNLSRGVFSKADITIKIAALHLDIALPLLRDLGKEAVTILPIIAELWEVIAPEDVVMGQTVEITLAVKAQHGKAAELRPVMLAVVAGRLAQAGVYLAE